MRRHSAFKAKNNGFVELISTLLELHLAKLFRDLFNIPHGLATVRCKATVGAVFTLLVC